MSIIYNWISISFPMYSWIQMNNLVFSLLCIGIPKHWIFKIRELLNISFPDTQKFFQNFFTILLSVTFGSSLHEYQIVQVLTWAWYQYVRFSWSISTNIFENSTYLSFYEGLQFSMLVWICRVGILKVKNAYLSWKLLIGYGSIRIFKTNFRSGKFCRLED